MGIKIKDEGSRKQAYLLPVQYETIAGVLLAECKALEILAESALPAEDRSGDDYGFDEAVGDVLYEMENRARLLTSRLANFRSALSNRPKPSVAVDNNTADVEGADDGEQES